MTRSSDEIDLTDLFADYTLGTLSESEVEYLEAQIKKQPELAEELAAFQAAFASLPYALPDVGPSPQLKGKLLAAASLSDASVSTKVSDQASDKVSHISTAPSFQPRSSRRLTWVSTSIAAVALIAFGFTQVRLSNQVAQNSALQAQLDNNKAEIDSLRNQLEASQVITARLGDSNAQIYSLVGTEETPEGTLFNAKLLATSGEREIVLYTENLPQLSSTQIYRLWAIPEETPFAETVYCGQFRQDSTGTAQWAAPDRACTVSPDKLLVTLDAPSDPITSAGPLVLESDA